MKRYVIMAILLFFAHQLTAQKPVGLNVNDIAPVFTAKDQNGKKFDLKKQLQKGPVVMIFYRGYWCPYCNKHLKTLEDSLSQITAKGATLVTITPEKPESIAKTITKTGAQYPILFDGGLKIMKAYDVAFSMDTTTIRKYKGYGIDLDEANGKNGPNLPVPAVYIIKTDGTVGWRYFDVNYSKRSSVKEILENL